jgi:hypothetical protein
VPNSKIRIRLDVRTDGFLNRIVCLTREASTSALKAKQRQVERQEFVKEVEVADEPVVVIKSEPEKPGNSVEGKTPMTLYKA